MEYHGEQVSQLEHALQAAHLAGEDGGDEHNSYSVAEQHDQSWRMPVGARERLDRTPIGGLLVDQCPLV